MQRALKKFLKFSLFVFAALVAFTFAFTSRSYKAFSKYTLVSDPQNKDMQDLLPVAHADGGFGGGLTGGPGNSANASDGWYGDGWGGGWGGDSSFSGVGDGSDSYTGDGGDSYYGDSNYVGGDGDGTGG